MDANALQLLDESENYCPDVVFKKANVLVSAKYRSSLLENKILAVAMSRIKMDKNNLPIAQIHSYELKKLLNIDGNSIYERLKSVAKQMSGRIVFMENEDKTHWNMQSIITGADYQKNKGVLTINFNPLLKDVLIDLKISYTKYYLPLLLSFSSVYSYRLYELLKSKAYRPKGVTSDGPYVISFGVNELKLTLGLVNTDTDKVKEAMQEANPDFDNIVENLAIEKVFPKWYDFKKYVLEVGIKEINENPMSDLTVSYNVHKGGQGGKVKDVIFTIIRRDESVSNIEKVKEPDAENLIEMVEKLQDEIDIPLKIKDIKAILIAADYDCDEVIRVYGLLKNQKNVKNVVGWMIDALKNQYTEPAAFENKTANNQFNEFTHRDYGDMDELEKKLLARS